ncbi:helix-turn-helix domain-containing protein [Alcaligenes sp. 1735tsa3]|uniref:helix-turn-helix domain-containing protein n=1 Tax=Alcaligenes sp. 1735tsa3 TaxID=2953809 RepID=UPI0020A7FB6A|nr:helix-turn-helix transcriptional regulator [Alcaligenes sp. 1735tsa3]USY26690.1 helix-turn-helix domain-containing protein [Alcaligenes sp. 1735tsa3]
MNATTAARVDNRPQRPSMDRAFRQALTDPSFKASFRERLGWDESQVSRFLSGQMGLTIDKIDQAIELLGMVVTTPSYIDFLAYGARIGANCHCVRQGLGECGR